MRVLRGVLAFYIRILLWQLYFFEVAFKGVVTDIIEEKEARNDVQQERS